HQSGYGECEELQIHAIENDGEAGEREYAFLERVPTAVVEQPANVDYGLHTRALARGHCISVMLCAGFWASIIVTVGAQAHWLRPQLSPPRRTCKLLSRLGKIRVNRDTRMVWGDPAGQVYPHENKLVITIKLI